jgi:hypothetical protein
MTDPRVLQQVHTIRRGLAEIVRRHQHEIPPRVVGELNAVIFEAIHEAAPDEQYTPESTRQHGTGQDRD